MVRWSVFLLLVGSTCSCRSPYNIYAPYGPQCVPPPATGTVGQPYYQPNYQTSPYGAYPGYPATPCANPYSTGSTQTFPAPAVSQQPPFSQSTYIDNQGGWSSSYPYPSSAVSPSSVATNPRPSGQFFSSNAASQIRENAQLPWTGNVLASGTYGNSGSVIANPIPVYGEPGTMATYASPVRPSIVRSTQTASYDAPLVYQPPAYYGNDYALPYSTPAGTTIPATESYGATSTMSANTTWVPRR